MSCPKEEAWQPAYIGEAHRVEETRFLNRPFICWVWTVQGIHR